MISTFLSTWVVLGVVFAVYVSRRVYTVITHLQTYKGIPRYYCLVDPISILGGFVLPRGSWNPGSYLTWDHGETLYTKTEGECVLIVPFLRSTPYLLISSPEAARDIMGEPFNWRKPEHALSLDFMGVNVVSSNPPVWRRHRKIAAPAFDNQTFANVWEVTTKIYHQMMNSSDWKSGDQHYFPSFSKFTTRLALLVIAGCGFNLNLEWETDLNAPNPIDQTVVTVSKTLMERIYIPRIFFALPSLQPIAIAFERFERFLRAEIVSKKAELSRDMKLDGAISQANKNLFGRLVAASEMEGAQGLEMSELVGNLFIFLFAGHETTAHSLVVTLALLASYPAEQERIYQHILSVLADGDPKYEHYTALTPVLHCFYEAVRLYPAAWVSLREPQTDTIIYGPNLTTSTNQAFCPKDKWLMIDIIGACRNARHFPSPNSFIPTRWAAPSPSSDPSSATLSAPPSADTFLGFSCGPRVCLGKKFATVEAVCFLTYLLRDWKVELKLNDGEKVEEWHRRVLRPKLGVTLSTGDVPLLLTRRVKG